MKGRVFRYQGLALSNLRTPIDPRGKMTQPGWLRWRRMSGKQYLLGDSIRSRPYWMIRGEYPKYRSKAITDKRAVDLDESLQTVGKK